MDLGIMDDRPRGLRRFCELLRTSPLVVVASPDRLLIRAVQAARDGRLVERYDWPTLNWDIMGEACDLFWRDADVWAWVRAHPHAHDGIHYRNMDAREWRSDMPRLDIPVPAESRTPRGGVD